MTSNRLSGLDMFGFHTNYTHPKKYRDDLGEQKQSNRRICGGYVPFLGIVVGKGRMNDISRSPSFYTSSARIAYRVRAIFEMMGLGLLLLPLDLLATVVRMLDAYVIPFLVQIPSLIAKSK